MVEQEDWVPAEAFRVAHDFRNKHAGAVPKSMMNQLIEDLN